MADAPVVILKRMIDWSGSALAVWMAARSVHLVVAAEAVVSHTPSPGSRSPLSPVEVTRMTEAPAAAGPGSGDRPGRRGEGGEQQRGSQPRSRTHRHRLLRRATSDWAGRLATAQPASARVSLPGAPSRYTARADPVAAARAGPTIGSTGSWARRSRSTVVGVRGLRSAAMATTTKQLVAHVLRRTTFGPFPGQVEELAPKGVSDSSTTILARPRRLAREPAGPVQRLVGRARQVVAGPDERPLAPASTRR